MGLAISMELQAVLDALPGYAALVDEQRAVVGASASFCARVGQRRDALVGASFPVVIQGSGLPLLACAFEAIARDGKPCEKDVLDGVGGRWLRSGLFPLALPAPQGTRVFLYQARDVTEDREVAHGLRRSLEHHEALGELLKAVQHCSSTSRILEVLLDQLLGVSWLGLDTHAACFVLRGEALELVASRNLSPFIVARCARLGLGECLCGKVARTEQALFTARLGPEHTIFDEGSHDHGHAILPLRYEERLLGVVNLYLPAGHELGEPERAFLRAAADVAASAVAEQLAREVATVARARAEASDRLSAIGRLAGGVAHDFNNLLSIIGGHADFAAESVGRGSPARADIEEIREAVRRATALTRQMLTFSRRDVVMQEVLSLNDVILNVAKLLRRTLGEHIRLETRLALGLARVVADPGQLEQVLVNLAVNARDAMRRGGTLTLATERIEGGSLEGGVALLVTDTGEGMTAEVLARAFEPFFTTKPLGSGTGLGLATVDTIVRQMGGNVRVRSEVGRGTTFELSFPPSRLEGQVSRVSEAPPAMVFGRGETVLLAEDEDGLRELARRILVAKGFKVLPTRNGREALAVGLGHPGAIDVLLSDVVMPDLSGVDLADELGRARPGLRVLLMSGYLGDGELHRSVVDGGFAFLPKPFAPEALARRVRELLDASPRGQTCRP